MNIFAPFSNSRGNLQTSRQREKPKSEKSGASSTPSAFAKRLVFLEIYDRINFM